MRRMLTSCACATLSVPMLLTECLAEAPDAESLAETSSRQTASLEKPTLPGDEVHLNMIDQKLALSLAVDMQAGIVAGEQALKSVSGEALRRLTTARLADQRAFADQLDALTSGKCKEGIAEALRQIEEDKVSQQPRAVSFRPAALQKFATALIIRVRLEILQETDALLWAQLNGKTSDDFDRQYLQNEVLRQMTLVSTLKVFQGQASDDFAQVIERVHGQMKKHCEQAQTLLLQMETAPLAASAVPPATTAATVAAGAAAE
jgi:hypothetical protein